MPSYYRGSRGSNFKGVIADKGAEDEDEEDVGKDDEDEKEDKEEWETNRKGDDG